MIPTVNKEFDNTFIVYNQSGFQIQRIHVDPEFKPMEDVFKYIYIINNNVTSQSHMP